MKTVNLKKPLPERKKTTIDISNCSNIENIATDNKCQLHLINKLYFDILLLLPCYVLMGNTLKH